jgi:hypothetical protein
MSPSAFAQTDKINNGNAASIYSNGGSVIRDHLALIIPQTKYGTITGGIPFIAPINTPIQPVHPISASHIRADR